ncbi:MAG: hypothetical protein H7Z76_10945 [Methylotenera sp.]|nr:hypothetical protein [Flavobacterium sp.]
MQDNINSEVQIIIEIKTIYWNENLIVPESNIGIVRGYEVLFHDIQAIPSDWKFTKLFHKVDGKVCGWINYTDGQKAGFRKWTESKLFCNVDGKEDKYVGNKLPSSYELSSFLLGKNIEINIESKEDFERLLGDYFRQEWQKEIEKINLPPAPKAEGKQQKAGRPESKEVAKRNQLIHNNYLKLKIDGCENVRGQLLIIYKRIFNHPNHETNRRNLDRIIEKMKDIN